MKFWLQELVSYFKKTAKIKIAYVISGVARYKTIQPSSRIRVFDIINVLRYDKEFHVSLYNPFLKYDVLIFQKHFDKKAYKLAEKNKQAGVKIVLDINVNYYNSNSQMINNEQRHDVIKFTKLCDYIITSSDYLHDYIKNIFPEKNIVTIYESIGNNYLSNGKIAANNVKNLIWSGYSTKAKEFLLIKDVLEKIYIKHKFKLIIISERQVSLDINIPIEFIKYDENSIVSNLMKGDVFIAPRNMQEEYNLGHSFTKIGVAMALGKPVIASPLPSYLKSPAIFCNNDEEWYRNLDKIFTGKFNLPDISKKGIEYCKQNYSIDVIKEQYKYLFKEITALC